MKKQIVHALVLKYEGQIAEAKANIDIYLTNPVGIGEHPEVLEAIHSQLRKIAEAEHHIEVLHKHFVDQKVI
tara:strand:- start:18 stop:233 length:216 start_codon:yes stop_codon:yes gene_type:complete